MICKQQAWDRYLHLQTKLEAKQQNYIFAHNLSYFCGNTKFSRNTTILFRNAAYFA